MLHDDEVIPKYASQVVIGRVKGQTPSLKIWFSSSSFTHTPPLFPFSLPIPSYPFIMLNDIPTTVYIFSSVFFLAAFVGSPRFLSLSLLFYCFPFSSWAEIWELRKRGAWCFCALRLGTFFYYYGAVLFYMVRLFLSPAFSSIYSVIKKKAKKTLLSGLKNTLAESTFARALFF